MMTSSGTNRSSWTAIPRSEQQNYQSPTETGEQPRDDEENAKYLDVQLHGLTSYSVSRCLTRRRMGMFQKPACEAARQRAGRKNDCLTIFKRFSS